MQPIPVYIVGGPGALAGAAAGGGGIYRAAGSSLPGKGGSLLGKAGRAAGAAGMLYGAWEIGDAIGTAINDNFIKGTGFGDAIGEGLNRVLAAFGNEESKRAIAIREREEKYQQQQASMKIEVVGNTPVRVRDMQATGFDLDVDAGMTMGP